MRSLLGSIRLHQNRKRKKQMRLHTSDGNRKYRNVKDEKKVEDRELVTEKESITEQEVAVECETVTEQETATESENMTEKVTETQEEVLAAEDSTTAPEDDFLLAQIDEFRVKAQHLQQLLQNKEAKAQELQKIVDEREGKAEELEQILIERQGRADGLTDAIEKKIDSMAGDVLEAIDQSLASNEKKSEEQTGMLLETMDQISEKADGIGQVSEQLNTVKADLSEKIHTESVQSYRNLSELLKNVNERLNKMDDLERQVKKLKTLSGVIIALTVVNLVGAIAAILISLGIF